MTFRPLLFIAIVALAAPAQAAIENRCWLQPEHTVNLNEPVTGFVIELDGVLQAEIMPPVVPPKVLAGDGECPAGGNDCDKYCADIDVTRPYQWNVIARSADGETYSANGPKMKLLPPNAPILLD